MMHILWYTGVRFPAVTGEGLNRAGWQEGLRRALQTYYPDLKLSIASFGSEAYQPFQQENATYYNIFREPDPLNRWARLIRNWRHESFQQEELPRCLEIYDLVKPDLVFIFGTENPFGLLSGQFQVPVVISIQAVLNGLVKRILYGLSPRELIQEFFSRETCLGQGVFHKWWSLKKYSRIEQEIYRINANFEGRTAWDRSWAAKLNPSARYFHNDRVLGEGYYQNVWSLRSSQPDLIFSLSGNAPFKGGLSLVRSLLLLQRMGRTELRLHLAGVSPDSRVGRHISRFLSQHGLAGQVRLLGRLSQAEIIQEMLQARLFVLPSHQDNSPNSLAEAMIMGMPCIASAVGGIPSMLEGGREGLLYQDTDQQDLADKICRLLDDPQLAQSLGEKARETALARHDPEKIARTTVRIYQDLIGSGEQGGWNSAPAEQADKGLRGSA